jgi:hypothetical protein
MMTRALFAILFDEDVETHLAPIECYERAAILDAIEEQMKTIWIVCSWRTIRVSCGDWKPRGSAYTSPAVCR